MKTILSAIVLSSLLVASPLSLAKGDQKHRLLQTFKGLELNQTQKDQIKALMQESKAERKLYMEDAKQSRQAIKNLKDMASWNEDEVTSVITTKVTNAKSLKLIAAKTRNSAYQLLSDEQRGLLAQRHAERAAKRAQGDRLQKSLDKLNLSDEQQVQVTALLASTEVAKTDAKTLRHAHKESEKALMQADTFDQVAWSALYDNNLQAMINSGIARAKFKYELANILSDKQLKKMKKMRNKQKQKKDDKAEGQAA